MVTTFFFWSEDGGKLTSKQDEVARLTSERLVLYTECFAMNYNGVALSVTIFSFRNELVRQRESLKQKIDASSLLPPGEEIRY